MDTLLVYLIYIAAFFLVVGLVVVALSRYSDWRRDRRRARRWRDRGRS